MTARDDVVWPEIGSWWRENDPRVPNIAKQVIAHDRERGKVQIRGAVTTWAKVERFNGKRSGYSRVERAK